MERLRPYISRGIYGLIIFGLLTLVVATCDNPNVSGSEIPDGKARVNFYLTDAPGDFQEVNIDVQGLQIHFAAETDSEGEWIDLPFDPMRVNLLDLTNTSMLVTSADLEPGHYKNLRLMLGTDNDVVIDGVTKDLMVPSGQETGYKIKFSTDLEEGEELDITIDFDAEKSVVIAGQSGMYILKPVLRAFTGNGENGGDDE